MNTKHVEKKRIMRQSPVVQYSLSATVVSQIQRRKAIRRFVSIARELASWDTWRERRKDAFSQQLKEATDKHPDANEQEIKHIRKSVITQLKNRLVPVTFHAAPFAPSSAVSIHVKKEMKADLAKNGFHRFTFDWNAPFGHDVLWNSVVVDITVRHWLPWASALTLMLPNHRSQASKRGLTRAKAQFTAEVAAQRKHTQYVSSTKRKAIQCTTTALSPKDDANTLPRRIGAHWRSPGMENIVRSLDHVALKRAKTTQKKMSVRGLLDRKDVRAPTAEERNGQPVPAQFPRDAYDTSYLQEEGEFQADHITTEAMDIEALGTEMIRKAFGAGHVLPRKMALLIRLGLNHLHLLQLRLISPPQLQAIRLGPLDLRCRCQDEGV
ncbi:hypothetical protein PSHT_00693 [Puccinia striiformis]|uniref:Uncharacterized protein n=1 Tax=Puccinia striiformis TaxID=27350 RepID=A0A2S4WMF8_9BASI|nr:hypothetical protein PSHT_00693 [Puccinia striiformis]